MGHNERARYSSIVSNVSENLSLIYRLRGSFQDVLTLTCPTCKRPVDPFPDACSAVMCLNCGSYYCNYCFLGFSSGNTEEDRALSHTHTAQHHPAEELTQRDAFLPAEVVKKGQLETQRQQLVQCIALAMSSKEFAAENQQCISLSLILLEQELKDLGLSVSEVWLLAEERLLGPAKKPSPTENEGPAPVENQPLPEVPLLPRPNPVNVNSGGVQLANALISNNAIAVRQILQAFRETMDVNYIEPVHSYPLTSLAILAKQKDVAQVLIRRGADPTIICRQNGRSILYLTIEAGYLDLLIVIIDKNPALDINMIVTNEGNGFTMLHVAAFFLIMVTSFNIFSLVQELT